MTTYSDKPNICTKRFARLIFGGIIPGGPGSDNGSALLLKAEASWLILCEDSNIASDERLSSVTKSTVGIKNRNFKQNMEMNKFLLISL